MDTISESIGRNIGILCRQLSLYINRELKDMPVTATEIMYLGALFQKDGLTQDDLVHEFCVDKAAASRTVQALESKGIVKREADKTDKRSKRIYLLPAAEAYRNKLSEIQQKWFREVMADITDEELAKLREILDKMIPSLIE